MTAGSALPAPTLLPLMRYRDLATSVTWLGEAFGFEKQVAVTDPDGSTVYAQMICGNSLLMLGSVRETDLDRLMKQPDEIGGVETQSCYVVVEDADQHYARAVAAGAAIVLDIKSDSLGRRGYSCRDPEGHIWSFGTYSPGKGLMQAEPAATISEAPAERSWGRRLAFAAALILTFMGGFAASRMTAQPLVSAAVGSAQDEKIYAELSALRAEKREAEKTAIEAKRALDQQLAKRAGDSTQLSNDLKSERAAREAIEKQVVELRADLEAERAAKVAAVAAQRDLERQLAQSRDKASALEDDATSNGVAETERQRSVIETASAKADADETSGDKTEGRAIETSATVDQTPAGPSQSKAVTETSKTQSSTRKVATDQRAKRTQSIAAQRNGTGYQIELSDVPWPLSAWSSR